MTKINFSKAIHAQNKDFVFFTNTNLSQYKFIGNNVSSLEKIQASLSDKLKNYNTKTVYLADDQMNSVTFIKMPEGNLNFENLREAGACLAKHLQAEKISAVVLHGDLLQKEADLNRFLHGVKLGAYVFDDYITKDLPDLLDEVTIISEKEIDFSEWDHLSESVCFARDLVNTPPNICIPRKIAEIAKSLETYGLEVKVRDQAELQDMGAGCILAIGQASPNGTYIIDLAWKGNTKSDDVDYALVGKGVTFDSGGLSIKSPKAMMDMKSDMAGSAAVLGAMKSIAQEKLPVNAVGVIAVVENMVDDNSIRPGDIVTSLSGKSVEIMDTDAEGRVILADALTHCQNEYKPKYVVDIATLTGSMMVALGFEFAGLLSNDNAMAEQLEKLGVEFGDKVWRLPIDPTYEKPIQSKIADIKNYGSPAIPDGIVAGHFLKAFIQDETKWAHLDAAGPCYMEDDIEPYSFYGATGYGVVLLYQLVKNNI